MTKKHFELVADAIETQGRVTYPNRPDLQVVRTQALTDIAEQLAVNFSRENSRFDRERFLSACGIK